MDFMEKNRVNRPQMVIQLRGPITKEICWRIKDGYIETKKYFNHSIVEIREIFIDAVFTAVLIFFLRQ